MTNNKHTNNNNTTNIKLENWNVNTKLRGDWLMCSCNAVTSEAAERKCCSVWSKTSALRLRWDSCSWISHIPPHRKWIGRSTSSPAPCPWCPWRSSIEGHGWACHSSSVAYSSAYPTAEQFRRVGGCETRTGLQSSAPFDSYRAKGEGPTRTATAEPLLCQQGLQKRKQHSTVMLSQTSGVHGSWQGTAYVCSNLCCITSQFE